MARSKAFQGKAGKPITVFLPKDLENVLRARAKKAKRSIRAEVRALIGKAYGYKFAPVTA